MTADAIDVQLKPVAVRVEECRNLIRALESKCRHIQSSLYSIQTVKEPVIENGSPKLDIYNRPTFTNRPPPNPLIGQPVLTVENRQAVLDAIIAELDKIEKIIN
ncbi:MAG: hypothetical protein K8823_1523 [Cenarchaeum symbiont of Oopsacas minuta]|nr:hypothetical protein [Cenarchaeum symbiont of Oopsacas minuta]